MPLKNPSIKLVCALIAIITQLIVSAIPASATGATPPLTKCHIQIHDAHISKYILRTQGKEAVKVNADSKCDKFIQDLRLTVEIYKIGRFTHYFITRHTIEISGFIPANSLTENQSTYEYCTNKKASRYYGIAYAEAYIKGHHFKTPRTISEHIFPINCGT